MSKGWAGIARLGGIGDNLISSVVLRPLKRMGYMVDVITSETASAVFFNNPFIDKLSVKKDGDLPGGEDWYKWFVSRGNEYELFVNLSNSCETRHALHKNTTAFWWPVEYRRKLCGGSYLETACEIAGVPFEAGPLFFPTEEEKTRAQNTRAEVGGRFVAWVLSGSRPDKVYPYAAMAICRIIKELNMPVVMIGVGGAQFEYAKMVQQAAGITNSSDIGLHLALSPDNSEPGGHQNWPTRRSLSLALAADLVITPDTGVGWACAMEPMPKIAMVSHASAENITKHWVNTVTLHADPDRVPCWPCHRLHDDLSTCVPAKEGKGAACMADISVETIIETVRKCLTQQHLYGGNVHALREAAE